MILHWRQFLTLTLWSVVSGLLAVEAAYPEVFQVVQKRNERLPEPVAKAQPANRTISIVGDQFMVDGSLLRIAAGSIHYFRMPAAYWSDRLRALRAAGFNSVTTYVEWSHHEPEERQYSFDGDCDIADFIRKAEAVGLFVILRVGPYICAERDLGGLPYWLLGKYPNIKLRTTDKDYIKESKIWIDKLFEQVKPLLYANGGPIILVQVENEYGSYGSDMAYKVQVRDMMHKHVGSSALLFTTDGSSSSYFRGGAVPNTLTTIDFNAGGDVPATFAPLRKFMPHGPLMNSEFYTGWLTHWGEQLAQTSADIVVRTLGDMLDYGANVNLYMFHGGSNFGYTSGANYGGTYQPDLTSYDYDSPLTEAGDPTPKYFLIREKMKQYKLVNETIEPPKPSQKGSYGPMTVTPTVSLLSNKGRSLLGKKYADVTGETLPTFEKLRQKGGLVLYETTLTELTDLLYIKKPHDLIFVYIDGVLKGRLSRALKIYSLPLTSNNGSVLSLLVENQGRINYGSQIHDFKGILSPVAIGTKVLNGKWTITGYPLETFSTSTPQSQDNAQTGPTFYEGHFTLSDSEKALDTFIDTTGWGKGYIWINGHNLGRYWPSVGPQITLYVPGVWLKQAPERNHLQILELDKPSQSLSMEFIDHPILNRTNNMHAWFGNINKF